MTGKKYLIWSTIILTFWNGIYFMEQVVSNYVIEKYKALKYVDKELKGLDEDCKELYNSL